MNKDIKKLLKESKNLRKRVDQTLREAEEIIALRKEAREEVNIYYFQE